jgi:hypothetical protein
MELLDKKIRELEVMAALCKLNPDSVVDDIAISVEATNKLAKSFHSKDEIKDPYLRWWDVFLKEWSYKCVVKWLDQYGDSKDYQRIQESWFSFEILWVTGCDIVRITRSNELKESISKAIARESPSQTDVEDTWQWYNDSTKQFDETVGKMIELFKEKQRKAITQTLKDLEGYDKDSLIGKLKRLLSL